MGFLEKAEKKVKEQKRAVHKKKVTDFFAKFKAIFKRKKDKKAKEKKKEKKEKPKKDNKKGKLPPLKKVLNIVFTFIVLGGVIIYILHEKKILIFNKWVWTIIGFILLTTILFVLNIMLHKWMQEKKKTVVKHMILSDKNEYKTDIDRLFDFVKINKKADLDVVAKEFSIPRDKVEEWAKILESSELITIHYPAFGDAQLVYKEDIKEKKKEDKKKDGRKDKKKRD